jgi:hypothetical protein
MPGPVLRNAVVKYLGTPNCTEGSVNEPRERQEHGMRFNEKWTYKRPLHDPVNPYERIICWRRYDYVGSLVRHSSASDWIPDTGLAAGLPNSADSHKE